MRPVYWRDKTSGVCPLELSNLKVVDVLCGEGRSVSKWRRGLSDPLLSTGFTGPFGLIKISLARHS